MARSVHVSDDGSLVDDEGNLVDVGTETLAAILTANGNLLTRAGGVPSEVTRASLAADTAFSGTYVAAAVLDAATYGDGLADATAHIQAKIDSLTDGGIVYVPVGTFRVDSTINLASGVWLRGSGAASVIERPAATGVGLPLIEGTTLDGVGVAHVKLDGGAVALSGNGVVHFVDCTDSGVERCVIRNTASNTPAIVMEGASGCRAVFNDIDGTGYGILVGSNSANGSTEANDNLIGFNVIRNTPFDSIFVTASLSSSATTNRGYRNKVIGNTVTDCGDAGIESGIGMTDNIIEGNTVEGSVGPNILVRDNIGAQINGNICTGNTTEAAGNYGGGIAVLDQTDVSMRISIVGNTCRDNVGSGIIVAPDSTQVGRDFVISGNHCRDNGGPGIYAWRCPGSTITGNLCAQNGSHGIYVKPVAATGEGNMSVTGNTCDGNTGHGIRVEANYVTLIGNRCFDSVGASQTHGIGIATSQANFLTIMGNIVQGNATAGISDDAAGVGHTLLNNRGSDNNRFYESSAFNLTASANFDVGAALAIGGNVGFYGTFPQAKPTGVAVTAGGIHAALVTLGLIS